MDYNTSLAEAANAASKAPASLSEARCGAKGGETAKFNNEASEALGAPMGVMFDLGWNIKGDEGAILTGLVLDRMAPGQKREGKRAESQSARVRCILANGLYASFFHKPSLVAYYRKGDAQCYQRGKRPSWYNAKAMSNDLDRMEVMGLVEKSLGEHGSVTSTYSLTPKLLIVAMELGIKDQNLTHDLWYDRLLRVYETNREGGNLVDVPLTADARRWCALLDDFNAFAAKHDIAIKLNDSEREQLLTRLNERRKAGLPAHYRPALIRTGLYRSFNYGGFDRGGRLYGGWWQNISKGLRHKITINGQPTVELDYSCFHIRMLYHLLGLAYDDDAYQIAEIVELEQRLSLPEGHYREAIKKITQALVNSPKGKKGERCKLPDGVSFYPHITRAEIRQMIEKKHQPIAPSFASGKGLELQRLDSDLAMQIIKNLQEKGVLVLPIHDSFIVDQRFEDELRKQMIDCYAERFKQSPVIH